MGSEVACKVMQLDNVPHELHDVLLQGVEGNLVGELSHPNIIRTFKIYHVMPPSGHSLESSFQKTESTEAANVGLMADQADSDGDSSLLRGGRDKGIEQLWIVQELCRGGDLGQAIHDKVGVVCGLMMFLLVAPREFLFILS